MASWVVEVKIIFQYLFCSNNTENMYLLLKIDKPRKKKLLAHVFNVNYSTDKVQWKCASSDNILKLVSKSNMVHIA